MTKWYCCERCNKVGSYGIDEVSGATTFDRGEMLVCGNKYDALTTGFATENEANAYLKKRQAEGGKDG